MKYLIYLGVAVLIVWAAAYLLVLFHRQLKAKRGCGQGGCAGCPHGYCRHRNVSGDGKK